MKLLILSVLVWLFLQSTWAYDRFEGYDLSGPYPTTNDDWYRKMPESVTIGKYIIEWLDGRLWITADGGEGGEFDEEAMEAAIDQFYIENF